MSSTQSHRRRLHCYPDYPRQNKLFLRRTPPSHLYEKPTGAQCSKSPPNPPHKLLLSPPPTRSVPPPDTPVSTSRAIRALFLPARPNSRCDYYNRGIYPPRRP